MTHFPLFKKTSVTRAIAVMALTVTALAGMTACSGQTSSGSSPSASADFKVLLLASESGSGASIGAAFVAATKAAIDVVNASGGADGKKMSLKVIDDGSDPQVGVTAMQTELASGTAYNLIIPGGTGAIAAAVEPTIAANPALQLSPAFIDDPKKYPRYFSTGGPVAQTQVVEDYVHSHGYKHIGILAVDNATSRAVVALHQAAAAKLGIEVTPAFVPAGAVDATSQMQQLLAANVDAMVFAGFDPQTASVSIIKAKLKLVPKIPIIADQTFSTNQLKAAGITNADLSGIHVQLLKPLVKGTDVADSAIMKSFQKALTKYSGGKLLPLPVTVIQFMTVAIAADGATAAHSVDGQKIATKLENISKAQLPRSVGPGNPFSTTTHAQQFTTASYAFLPMTVDTDAQGFTIPGND